MVISLSRCPATVLAPLERTLNVDLKYPTSRATTVTRAQITGSELTKTQYCGEGLEKGEEVRQTPAQYTLKTPQNGKIPALHRVRWLPCGCYPQPATPPLRLRQAKTVDFNLLQSFWWRSYATIEHRKNHSPPPQISDCSVRGIAV